MKFLKSIKLTLLILLVYVNALSQLRLGEATLFSVPAPSIKNSVKISTALKQAAYLGKIGGIAFDKEALPANGLNVNSMELTYHSGAADGERLTLMLNDAPVKVNLYDWELIPIAKYANSDSYACFTLFGSVNNEDNVLKLIEDYGFKLRNMMNYHPEFVNTLMGLRLFQLDLLIVDKQNSVYLPKNNDTLLLGAGETEPNIESNKQGVKIFDSIFNYMPNKIYESYLICDTNRVIIFNISDDILQISEQPFYYFFRYKEDEDKRDSVENRIDISIDSIKRTVLGLTERNASLEKWYLRTIYKLDHTDETFNPADAQYQKFVRDWRTNLRDGYKTDYPTTYFSYYLEDLDYELKTLAYEKSRDIEYLSELSETLSQQPEIFRNINPAVWDAGTKTMQYAAFFRYCKMKFPKEWQKFMNIINSIRKPPTPTVQTPTIIAY